MKLTLKNRVQVTLFKHEIRGQLSDGHWENSGPRGHWRDWCECEVVVGEATGRDFYPLREKYALTNSKLLEAVGDRMIQYARLAKVLDEPFLGEAIDALHASAIYLENEFSEEFLTQVRSVAGEEFLYSRRDLLRDLREIKDAMGRMA